MQNVRVIRALLVKSEKAILNILLGGAIDKFEKNQSVENVCCPLSWKCVQ